MSSSAIISDSLKIETPLGTFPVSKYKTFFNTSKIVSFGVNPSNIPTTESQSFHFGHSIRRPIWNLGYEEASEGGLKLVTTSGEESRFLLKGQSDSVPLVPELEMLVLDLAILAGLDASEAKLVNTPDKQTSLLLKRADAPQRNKKLVPVQPVLSNATAATTWEQLALEVKKTSSNSGFDLLGILERALFSYLVGAYNVSPRKFFLVTNADGIRHLGPISGYLPMLLMFSKQIDPQDFAFSLNGKTRKLSVQDFLHFGSSVGLYGKQIDNAVKRFADVLPIWEKHIRDSSIPTPIKSDFLNLLDQRSGRLMLRRRF